MSLVRERSIVVVEDSEEDFTAFRRALKRSALDIKIVRYENGEDFLAGMRAGRLPMPPTIVVLDLNLPVLSGHEVLREIRDDARLRGLPVIVLSTSSNPEDVRKCYDMGIGGYIVKKGDFTGFSDTIQTVADYWLGAVHLP